MSEYHVHVYFPARMVHYEIEAEDAHAARRQALDRAEKDSTVILSDTKMIAMTWDGDGQLKDMGR